MIGQLGGQVDRRRPVGPPDDGDGGRFGVIETESLGAQQGAEDPELGCSPEKKGLRLGQQRAEVGHGSDAQKDQGRKDPRTDPEVDVPDQPALLLDSREGQIDQNGPEADGDEQQRLVLPGDAQIDQQPPHGEHTEISQTQGSKTGGAEKICNDPQDAHLPAPPTGSP